MKVRFATIAMLGLLGIMTAPAHATNSNVENALAGRADLSMFHQALINTGVANELQENMEYTIFAPTDAAFSQISPSVYPCFYSVQCRAQVAAVLRNHIVPRNESVYLFSKWGGGIPTLGNRTLYVEEPYKDQYTVEGRTVLDQMAGSESLRMEGERVSLYRIDGVIIDDNELAQFRNPHVANGAVVRRTVTTTYMQTPPTYGGYVVPGGGYPADGSVYVIPNDSAGPVVITTTHGGE
ncbi:MAG: fasciclin domain-containing protein [Alphaproteobacteria bacterium]